MGASALEPVHVEPVGANGRPNRVWQPSGLRPGPSLSAATDYLWLWTPCCWHSRLRGQRCCMRARLLVAALCVSPLCLSAPAHGIANDVFLGCGGLAGNDDASFEFVGFWPNDARDAVTAGLRDWGNRRDLNGQSLVNIFIVGPGQGGFPVTWEETNGFLGFADCDPNDGEPDRLIIDDDLGDFNYRVAIARHEGGHVLGLNHTGWGDSHDGVRSSMTTCQNRDQWVSTAISQDDVSGLAHAHSDANPRTLTANLGFEQGLTYWFSDGATTYINTDTSAASGTQYAVFSGGLAERRLLTSTRVGVLGSRSVRATAAVRKIRSTDVGSATIDLYVRDVTYGAGACANNFIDGRDWNASSSPVDWLKVRVGGGNPSTSWTSYDTAAWTTFANDGALDLRVEVHDGVNTSSGGSAGIHVDEARVRCLTSNGDGRCT